MSLRNNSTSTGVTVRCCAIVTAIALVAVLICPFPFADLMIGGFVGTMVAQLLFSRRIGVHVIGGFTGGLIAIGLSLLTSVIVTGDVPILITSWWDVLWLTALMLWTIPGIVIAEFAQRLASGTERIAT